jgi:hypothetical protein
MTYLSKQTFYIVISSSILIAVLLFPTFYNIEAQEENGEETEKDPRTILSNIRTLLNQSITELNAGNNTGASELVDLPILIIMNILIL